VSTLQATAEDVRSTSTEEIDRALDELVASKTVFQATALPQWMSLIERCIPAVREAAPDWVDAACAAKGIPAGSTLRAEEVTAGPAAALRYLRLLHDSLQDIESKGRPQLPGPIRQEPGGRLFVRLAPVKRRHDALLFPGATPDA